MYAERLARARARMRELGVDVLLLSTGADLPYLTGYEAMPLERLTMLVVPADADAVLVIPTLEAPRVVEQPDAFELFTWDETDAEMRAAITDLRNVGVEVLTVGQYLRPSPAHAPVVRWWTPAEFDAWRAYALDLGFAHVECGPLVRSSYHAKRAVETATVSAAPAVTA